MYYDKNEKTKKKIYLALCLLVLIVLGFIYYHNLTKDKQEYIIKGNGRIEGNETVISTKFAGQVVELKADEGDYVRKGDLLAVIDTRSLSAEIESDKMKLEEISKQISSIDGDIKAVKSDINLFEKEVSRTKALIKRSFSSQLELDRNTNSLEKAQAQLLVLESNRSALKASYESLKYLIKSKEINKEDMSIIAPTDGVILYRLVENGENLGANGKLFVMYNPDDLYMTVYMPSKLAGQVKIGDEAYIKLDAYKNESFSSKVTFVAENAEFTPKEVETQEEREKLVFRVKVVLNDNSDRKAKPGMPGDGYIKIDNDKDWPSNIIGD